jgi:dipeptidase E
MVYGGWSAGAAVAGRTLRGIDLMDDPTVVVGGYMTEPTWDGLGLVDYAIVPHFESEHPEAEAAQRAHAYMTANGIAHRTLRDGEVIVE